MASPGETAAPSPAEHAAWLAALAWGGRPWDRLVPAWRGRLLARPRAGAPLKDEARRLLREAHQAHARVEFARVHPSWLARALQGELPAVRRAVIARLAPTLRDELRTTLAIPADDLTPPHEPLPEAVTIAESLWTERLVGGPDRLPDDPPIVQAIAQARGAGLSRLAGLCALAKRAYLPSEDDLPRLAPSAQHLLEGLRPGWQHFQRSRDLEALAWQDLRGEPGSGARDLARHGLPTLARLLLPVDPIRSRWTLQHLPYRMARPLRSLQKGWPYGFDPSLLLAWEGRVLELAREVDAAVADLEGDDPLGEPSP